MLGLKQKRISVDSLTNCSSYRLLGCWNRHFLDVAQLFPETPRGYRTRPRNT